MYVEGNGEYEDPSLRGVEHIGQGGWWEYAAAHWLIAYSEVALEFGEGEWDLAVLLEVDVVLDRRYVSAGSVFGGYCLMPATVRVNSEFDVMNEQRCVTYLLTALRTLLCFPRFPGSGTWQVLLLNGQGVRMTILDG